MLNIVTETEKNTIKKKRNKISIKNIIATKNVGAMSRGADVWEN